VPGVAHRADRAERKLRARHARERAARARQRLGRAAVRRDSRLEHGLQRALGRRRRALAPRRETLLDQLVVYDRPRAAAAAAPLRPARRHLPPDDLDALQRREGLRAPRAAQHARSPAVPAATQRLQQGLFLRPPHAVSVIFRDPALRQE